MPTTRHTASACPHCNYEVDASTDIAGGRTPRPGDISLCINCAGWMEYGEGLALILPTISEFEILLDLPAETRAKTIKIREAIIALGRRS